MSIIVTDDLAGFLEQILEPAARGLTSPAPPPTNRCRTKRRGTNVQRQACQDHRRRLRGAATRSARRPRARCARRSTTRSTCSTPARRAWPSGRPDGTWHVNQWLKKAVLLSFRLNDMSVIAGGPGKAVWWDKVDSKFKGWSAANFKKAGFRAVPGSVVRRSAYIAPGVVLMPSFVNLGACVDCGTMVDTWATVGSLRADRQELPFVGRRRHRRRARAAAGGPRDHRGQLLHRRALGSRRRRDRARGLGARHGRLSRPLDQDRRPRERQDLSRRSAALFGGGARARCRASRCRTASRARASIAPSSSSAWTSARAPRPASTNC